MINTKEIRIGNLVEYRITDKLDERKEWLEVSEIDADDIHWLSKVDTKDEDFRAILITEEWLLNLGFKKDNKLNYVFHFEFNEGYEEITVELYKGGENDFYFRGNILHNDLKYVHQIQNLYFALTQRELTVA